jgi:dynein heavy chain 1
VSLAADVWWSTSIDAKLIEGKSVESVLELVTKTLALLSDSVLQDQPAIRRKKIENMVRRCVYSV